MRSAMRTLPRLLAMLSLAACTIAGSGAGPGAGPAVSGSALCDALLPLADAHAAALLADGGDRSVVTGAELLAGLDAGCGRTAR